MTVNTLSVKVNETTYVYEAHDFQKVAEIIAGTIRVMKDTDEITNIEIS